MLPRPGPFALALLLGCSAAAGEGAIKTEIPGLSVEIEQVPEDRDVELAHPAVVPAEQLSTILGMLRLRGFRGLAEGQPVFDAVTAQAVARHISEGLAGAGPRERVWFWYRRDDREPGPVYKPSERHTRGVAFVDPPGVLNIAFDLVRDQVDNTARLRDPVSIKQHRARLNAPVGTKVMVTAAGQLHPLWLTWQYLESEEEQVSVPEAKRIKLELLDELRESGDLSPEDYERRRREILEQDPP